MTTDELGTPLVRKKKSRLASIKLPFSAGQLVAGLLAIFLLAFFGFAFFNTNPLGGEPGVRITLDPAKIAPPPAKGGAAQTTPAIVKGASPAAPGGAQGGAQTSPAATPPAGAGQKTITIIDGSSGEKRDVIVPSGDGTAPGANPGTAKPPGNNSSLDQGLFETSRYGAIPKIAPTGLTPMQAVAQAPLADAATVAATPGIAIVVTSLGIGAARTDRAMEMMPPATTFGFLPYGAELDALVARARQGGHEVLLQLPMEPFDYPDNDPGPQTLLTSASPEQNIDRLAWHMSRFKGYVGVANYMGARFITSEPAMQNMMRDLGKRGLIFFDDGATPRSAAAKTAKEHQVVFAGADVTLDNVAGTADIDRLLMRLEGLARQKGIAILVTAPLPVALEKIASWSKTLQSKGILLLPLSAAVRKNAAS